jgi:LacI family transcriptional regulator
LRIELGSIGSWKDGAGMSKSRRIIVAVHSNASYGREILKGVRKYCLEHPQWEIFYESAISAPILRRIESGIRSSQVDGIVGQLADEVWRGLVRKTGVPSVNVSAMRPDCGVFTVMVDYAAVGKLGAAHLLDKKLSHFAYCSDGHLKFGGIFESYCCELARAGVNRKDISLLVQDEGIGDRDRMCQQLHALKKPVGVFAGSDPAARTLVWTCRRLGLHVPEEVAVLGIGDDELECNLCEPPLSSVVVPAQSIGYKAAGLMEGILRGKKPRRSRIILVQPLGVAERQSTNVLAVEDREVALALRFIREHAGEPILVKDILNAVPLGRRTLEQRFIKVLGRTPRAEIISTQINRAKLLLRDTDLKISVVSAKSGLPYYPSFRTFFRKEVGMSAAEYRRQFRSAQMRLR